METKQPEKIKRPYSSIRAILRREKAGKLKQMSVDEIIVFLREHDTLKTEYNHLKIDYDSLKARFDSFLSNKKRIEELEQRRQKLITFKNQKTHIDKIKFIIKEQDRFLTAKEITKLLHNYHQEIGDYFSWSNPQQAVSQYLFIASGYGQIKKVIIKGKSAHFFGLS